MIFHAMRNGVASAWRWLRTFFILAGMAASVAFVRVNFFAEELVMHTPEATVVKSPVKKLK